MAGPEFFQTMMGRKFYEADMPRLISALERIAAALEKRNEPDDPFCGTERLNVKEIINEVKNG